MRTVNNRVSDVILKSNRMHSVYAGGYKITDALQTGQWTGQRCFIIGGGESLKGFDFNLLKGERVIAINRAFEYCDFADIWYAMDVRFYNDIRNGIFDTVLGGSVYAKWKAFQGIKAFLCPINHYKFYDKVYFIRRFPQEEVVKNLADGIYGGSNSGFGALMLAIALGANPIYLLGYDMRIRESTHFHSGYEHQKGKKDSLANKIGIFRKLFEDFADKYPKDVQIINLCLDSAIECFPKDHIYNVFQNKISDMVVANGKAMIDIELLDRLIHEYKELYCDMLIRGKTILETFDKLLSEMNIQEKQQKEVCDANL